MIKECYKVNYEGEKFEQLMEQYFQDTPFKFKVEKTFFDSIGIFRARHFPYSIRCVFSKEASDLLVSVDYSIPWDSIFNKALYLLAVLLFAVSTLSMETAYFIIFGGLILLLSVLMPSISEALEKKLHQKEGNLLSNYIDRNIPDTKTLDAAEYDALLKDRYCAKE